MEEAPKELFRGLDLARPDRTTAAELEEFEAYAEQPGGRPLPSSSLWGELRPDLLKRQLRFTKEIHGAESRDISRGRGSSADRGSGDTAPSSPVHDLVRKDTIDGCTT